MSDESGDGPDTIPFPGRPPPGRRMRRDDRSAYSRKPTFTDLRNERFADQSRFLRREHRFRLVTAVVVFAFVMGWMVGVAGILVAQGAGRLDLPEKVLIALLVTTTLNVVGLLAAAVRYFFPLRPAIFGQTELPQARPGGGKSGHPKRGPTRSGG